jgi:hypothetical protein
MKLLWFGYLVYSLGNCAMKLCTETGLMCVHCACGFFSRRARLFLDCNCKVQKTVF